MPQSFRARVRALVFVGAWLMPVPAASAQANVLAASRPRTGPAQAAPLRVDWAKTARVSVTSPTTQHLGSAWTLRTNPHNKALLGLLRGLGTNDTRVQLWNAIPRQAVAELRQPTATRTFWDFRYMDQTVLDFYKNTHRRRNVNIGTIPAWMFSGPQPTVPSDPGGTSYSYGGAPATALKDPSGRQFAAYQARVFRWFTQGGFRDELGRFHRSRYHLKIDYWGVLNEPTLEHGFNVQQYTHIYDSVVAVIHKIDPRVKFIAPELVVGDPLQWAQYFLNPRNHRRGIPLDFFDFHNYVVANNDPATWQNSFFTGPSDPALDVFTVKGLPGELRKLIATRDRLSPRTQIAIDELGSFDVPGARGNIGLGGAIKAAESTDPYSAYVPLYWVAAGANWAANFITAERLGLSILSMTQLLGYPQQSESTSMIDWETGRPNAHYWSLKLVAANFGPGDKLVPTSSGSPAVLAQAARTPGGRKVLLVNISGMSVRLHLPNGLSHAPARVIAVDSRSGERPPRRLAITHNSFTLRPFATAVIAATLIGIHD